MRHITFIFFLLLGLSVGKVSAQQVTRAELLQWYHDAQALTKKGDVDGAIEIYEKMKKNAPDLTDPYVKLGDLYSQKGDLASTKKALVNYQKYLDSGAQIFNKSAIQEKIEKLTDAIVKGEVKAINPEQKVEGQKTETAIVLEEKKTETPKEEVPKTVEQKKTEEPQKAVAQKEEPKKVVETKNAEEPKKAETKVEVKKSAPIKVELKTKEEAKAEPAKSAPIKVELKEAEPAKVEETAPQDTVMVVKAAASDDDYAQSTLFDFEDADSVEVDDSIPEDSLASQPDAMNNSLIKSQVSAHHSKLLIVPSDYAQQIADQLVEASGQSFFYNELTAQQKAAHVTLVDLYNQKLQSAQGNAFDQNDLAWLYMNGIGTKQDFKNASSNLASAREKNNLFALINMGVLLENGLGVAKDVEQAAAYYKKAADQGYVDAYVLLGDLYKSQVELMKDAEKLAVTNYQAAYFKNNPAGIYKLGLLYLQGDLIEKDEQKGVSYLERAANMQYAPAILDLGKLNFYGLAGLKVDEAKGLDLILKATHKNNANAMLEMAYICLKGLTGNADLKSSREWLVKAKKVQETEFYGVSSLTNNVRKVLFPEIF